VNTVYWVPETEATVTATLVAPPAPPVGAMAQLTVVALTQLVVRQTALPTAADEVRHTEPKSRPVIVTVPAPVMAALVGKFRLITGASKL
jgi:hypothetical protein